MILTTTEFIPDYEITKIIDVVSGNNVLDLKTTKRDIQNKSALNEICPTILKNARTDAINKMIKEATVLNADAIISMKIETNITGKVIEFFVYGTAVKILPFEDEEFFMDEEEYESIEDEEYESIEDEEETTIPNNKSKKLKSI